MKRDEWLVIGTPVPLLKPTKAPRTGWTPQIWIDLLARFGPGTFNDFLHVLPNVAVSSYGQRLGMEDDPVLAKHLVVAESDNGDVLTWDSEQRATSPLYHFAPRSFEPEKKPVARTSDELLDRLAKRNLFFDRGPLRPFFVPRNPKVRRERRSVRVAGQRGTSKAFDRWLSALGDDRIAVLLDREQTKDWVRCILHIPACAALVRAQHAGNAKDGFWQLVVDVPAGTKGSALAALVDRGADIGWSDAVKDAIVRAKARR